MRQVTKTIFVDLPGAHVCLYQNIILDADKLFKRLLDEVDWRTESIKLFGRKQPIPRLTRWMGDSHYTYSGIKNQPLPWTTTLQKIRHQAESLVTSRFNGVLLNLYRCGQDSMGWHADDEKSLGNHPTIVSVNLGGTRRIRFKPKPHFAAKVVSLDLPHASALVMRGKTQENRLHTIPKTTKPVGMRINLTFRKVHNTS